MAVDALDDRIPPDEALDPVPTREDEFVPYGGLDDGTITLVTTTEEVNTVILVELLAPAPVPIGAVYVELG
jgi:hypothetical protein